MFGIFAAHTRLKRRMKSDSGSRLSIAEWCLQYVAKWGPVSWPTWPAATHGILGADANARRFKKWQGRRLSLSFTTAGPVQCVVACVLCDV